ncbi:cytochrome P450 [Cyathus striatus]|nr:cytochrome P450 [Cyathus striatus]
MSSTISAALTLLTLAILYRILQSNSSNPINIPYPPGPKGTFLIQNLLDIPKSRAWFTYTSWKKKYGNFIFLRVLGQKILVVNSRKDAIALFEKRSRIYSDRPQFPAVDMMGWDFNSAGLQYSNKWRKHRKIYQQFLRSPLTHTFHPIQRTKVHAMLKDLLNDPHNFKNHSRRCSGAIIMKIIYNIDVSPSPKTDFYIEVAEAADTNLSLLAVPSAIFANIFPLIYYIPTWFPVIGSIKRILLETRELTHQMMSVPFDVALKNPDPASGVAMRLLAYSRSRGANPSEEYAIREVCATAYSAGTDTTVSAMGTFFLAMLTSPNAQLKAQNEIDNVIGTTRLPEYDDRESLPYVEAVFREVMRWNPVLPLAVPRYTTADDVYNGYYVPKGTIVIPNMWAMAHDESIYPDPNKFKPERFFKENGQLNGDISELPFGFGRRICPGRHMASATVWLTIATILSAFNIRKAKDDYGNEIPVSGVYTDATVSHPEPFKCSITPRSEAAIELINSVN